MVSAIFLVLTKKQGVIYCYHQAGIAQLVEHKLPKLGVAGSNPVARSKIIREINSIIINNYNRKLKIFCYFNFIDDLETKRVFFVPFLVRHFHLQCQISTYEKIHAVGN